MSDVLPIKLQVTGDTKAVAAVRKEIEQLAAASSKTATQASAASAKQAQAYSKIQQAAAQTAAAEQRRAGATSNAAAADSRAAAAATGAATAELRKAAAASNAAAAQDRATISALRLAQAQQKAGDSGSYFSKVGDTIKGSILGIVGPAAIVTTTIAALKGSFDLAQAGASVQAVEQSFTSLAASGGKSADTLLAKMNAAAQGTISDAKLMESANTGMLLTNGKLANELPKLIEIARASAKATGQEVGFVFDSLVRGIARGSPMIIDNAGITLNASAAFETYAASIGKSADQLTKSEQQQATLNAVMASGGDIIAKTGGAVENNATLFAQSAANVENAKNALASLLADGIAPVASGFGMLAGAIAGTDSSLADSIGVLFNSEAANIAHAQAQVQAAAAADRMKISQDEDRVAVGQLQVATQQAQAAVVENAVAIQQSAAASVLDAQNKQVQAAATALVEAQTKAAAQAFLALNPNIDAAGIAALVAANKIDASTAAYAQGILLIARYKAQLAGLQAQAGAGAGFGSKVDTTDRGARSEEAAAIAAAQRDRTLAVGTTQQKIALYQQEYQAAVQRYGAESSQAYAAQTKILQATTQGSAARASSAGAAATKLQGIEQKTGDKLAQIVQDTQAKLVAIDQKAAAERAKIAADLANKMATSAADRRASNEADDLELIGVTDEKAAQKLNDREQAQAAAREREVAAAKEAQDAIANGEAESASKVYDIREKQISDQQSLDEKYAERQRELAGNDEQLAALKQQYDEATRANDEAAQTRIAIAKAEAEQKKAEQQAEKDAVIAAANEQANQVVSAAERSAAGVTKATGAAKAQATADLRAIGDAVTAIPTSKTITITVNQQGNVSAASSGGSGGAPAARAAGGDTNVGRVTLVGEQGPELVVFSSPGRVYPASKTQAMLASGAIPGLAGGGTIDAGNGYTTPVAGSGAAQAGKGGSGKGTSGAAQSAKDALAEQKEIVALLSDMIQLRHDLEEELRTGQPFNVEAVAWLAKRAAEFTQLVRSNLVPTTKKDGEALKLYTDAAKESIGILSDVASLRHDLQGAANEQPFDMGVINGLVFRAHQFTELIRASLVPTSEVEADQVARYADAVSSTIGILSDVAKLRHELQDAAKEQPFSFDLIRQLADTATLVTLIVRERLVPTSEAQADAMSQYASAVGDSVSILNDVLDLGKSLKENGVSPISDQTIIALADEAVRVSTLVQGRLIPVTEAQNDAVSAYADLVGASVSVLKDVAGLSGDLFTDYTSPTDAQIALLATDAKRITDGFFKAGELMGKEGAEAGKAYAEGVGAAFSAAKDGLLVIDALKSGDFVLPDGALKQYETASLQILDVMQALGARAATIPTTDIAALQNVTSAISGQAEALIKLAAVPFGDLAGAGPGLGQGGGALGSLGGTTTVTNYNTFNLPQGSNQQTAQEVIRILNRQVGARR